MKLARTPSSAFTLIELLIVISIIAILASLAIPAAQSVLVRGQLTGTLSNARQLHMVTQTMSLDTFNAGGDGLEWTMSNNGTTNTPVSLSTYFSALTNNNYLTDPELRKLLSAPGKQPTTGALGSGNIAFKFFAVSEESSSDQPFVVTANWGGVSTGMTTLSPYGKKGFVVFNKGGGGNFYTRPQDATSTNIFSSGSGDQTNNLSQFLQ